MAREKRVANNEFEYRVKSYPKLLYVNKVKYRITVYVKNYVYFYILMTGGEHSLSPWASIFPA